MKTVYVPGSTGLVGSAVTKLLLEKGYEVLKPIFQLGTDLRVQSIAEHIFEDHDIDYVVNCAAMVGGIQANATYPYKFIYDNIMIQSNLINYALNHKVQKFIYLGSSCIYPKLCPQPIKQQYLLTSQLQLTNQWYSIAKIAGLKMCQAANQQFGITKFISLMPTNLYGQNDNFDLQMSHVIPSMIRKFHEALPDKSLTFWGDGSPRRQFMHVNDLAKCILFTLQNQLKYDNYNVGTGKDLTIKELAQLIQKIVGHQGIINWDVTKPNGTPKRLLDVSRINEQGWKYQIQLEYGLKETYKQYLNKNNVK